MKVKGIVIVDLVRIIRSAKGTNFDQHLTPEDKEIIHSTVLTSRWYPGDSFWRLAYATAKEVAQMQRENLIAFGRLSAQTYLKVYTRLVVPGDPAASLERCVELWDSFYDFEGAPFRPNDVQKGADWIQFKAYDYPDMIVPGARTPYFLGLAGYYLEIAEQALGRKIKHEFIDRGDHFELTYRWA